MRVPDLQTAPRRRRDHCPVCRTDRFPRSAARPPSHSARRAGRARRSRPLVSRHAAGAHLRAQARGAVPPGQDRRRGVSRHGPGGDRDRRRQPARARTTTSRPSRAASPAGSCAASSRGDVHGAVAGQGHRRRRTAASSACFSPTCSGTASRRITTARWRRGFPRAPASRWRSSIGSSRGCTSALTGDGATSPGDFYEGLNFAAIHKLPLVVVVENNCYAYSTPTNLQMPVANVADRAPAFNIPADHRLRQRHLRGAAAGAHGASTTRAAARGPYLVEFKTFRQRGHGEHDDMALRARASCASSGSAAIRSGCCRSTCSARADVPADGRRAASTHECRASRRGRGRPRPRRCPSPSPSTVT